MANGLNDSDQGPLRDDSTLKMATVEPQRRPLLQDLMRE